MSVLSVDLAQKSYGEIGVVVLQGTPSRQIVCEKIVLQAAGKPESARLAHELVELSKDYGCNIIILDGPQAWKHPDNGHPYQRDCERKLNTPAKTGLPGHVLPANYKPFVCFAIDVFNYLSQFGFVRLQEEGLGASGTAVESFPFSAWRSLGLKPLKAKAKCQESDVQAAAGMLREKFPLHFPGLITHDQLQAIVSGLGALAMELHVGNGFEVVGHPPVSLEGIWREGFIVNPRPWEFWELKA